MYNEKESSQLGHWKFKEIEETLGSQNGLTLKKPYTRNGHSGLYVYCQVYCEAVYLIQNLIKKNIRKLVKRPSWDIERKI